MLHPAPKGEVDGFVLGDGTQVHVPPHQAAALAVFTARPGDTVSVQGRRAEGGSVIEAGLIRNQTSGVALENRGPRHERDGAGPGRVSGKVQFLLHGPRGEANGAILEDGTVLRPRPPRPSSLRRDGPSWPRARSSSRQWAGSSTSRSWNAGPGA